ncbi:MAG: hypothetical protein HOL48_06400, partial [Porticoccaceae bacterium]|nr:hypothetical protein [Porticoccaceae bacterium]
MVIGLTAFFIGFFESVPLTNATGANATLYGWLDLNQDGDFNDTNESQSATVLAGSSFGTLT